MNISTSGQIHATDRPVRVPLAVQPTPRTCATLRLESEAPSTWAPECVAIFIEALARMSARPGLKAVVLTGLRLFDGRLHESDAVHFEPALAAIAANPVPVIAVIPGDAAGSGLELALACAGRIAAPTSTFSLPGVTQARLPRIQTLEALPRLVGADAAASIMALGQTLDAAEARALGLVDRVSAAHTASDILDLAAARASRFIRSDADPARTEAEFLGVRIRLRRQALGQTTPVSALRALEAAALLPHRRLRAEVDRIAADLVRSPQGAALRYAAAGAAELEEVAARDGLDGAALAAELGWALRRETIHLIDDGATPSQVDRCLQAYGFAEGPFAQSDRLGLAQVFAPPPGSQDDGWIRYWPTLDLMRDSGRHGGAAPGWRREGHGEADGRDYPEVLCVIRSSAIFQRLHRAPVGDEEVAARSLNAAINASAWLLERHPHLSARAIDALWTSRLGFPGWKGGPLFQAERIGLQTVVEALVAQDRKRGASGPPCALLVRRAPAGRLDPTETAPSSARVLAFG